MSGWRSRLGARSPRSRQALVSLAAILALAGYAALVATLDGARDRLRTNVSALRVASQQMEQHAGEIERLRAAPKPAPSSRELRAVLEAEAKAGGFAHALRAEAAAGDEARASVGSVPFPDWLAWLERLKSANVYVKSCRVETAAPGLVTATATLARTQ